MGKAPKLDWKTRRGGAYVVVSPYFLYVDTLDGKYNGYVREPNSVSSNVFVGPFSSKEVAMVHTEQAFLQRMESVENALNILRGRT